MNIHDEIAKHFEYVKQEPRFQQQRKIEDAIMAFGPDFMESLEIMSAIMATLGRRYEQDISDVDQAFTDLKDALLEADATEQRAFDEYNNRLRQISEKGE